MKKQFIFLNTVLIGLAILALTGCSVPKDVTITVKDTNKTPGISVKVYSSDSEETLLSGETNTEGIFEGKIQISPQKTIKLKYNKADYVIRPKESVKKPTGKPLAVSVNITAESVGKLVTFKMKNSIPNVQVIGIDEKGAEKSLGMTDQQGILKKMIKKREYKQISFRYSLFGSVVSSDQAKTFTYNSIPKIINLKAIPDKDLLFYFYCQDDNSKSGLSGVYIHGDNPDYAEISDDYGKASVRIRPNEEDGPFIGDVLTWNGEKDNYTKPPAEKTELKVGVFIYPEQGLDSPYTYSLMLEYEMPIRVFEGNYPISGAEIFANGKLYNKTDESGAVSYKYYDKDIKKDVTFEIVKEGLSADPRTMTLGKIEREITFRVITIHVFLSFIDSETKKSISGLKVTRDGKVVGQQTSKNQLKINFPKKGSYSLKISDGNKSYLEKLYALDIKQNSIGKVFTVPIDPITGVSFTCTNKANGEPLKGVHVFRDGKEIGQSNKNGKFSQDYNPDPQNYYHYSFKADHYLPIKNKRIYRRPGRTKEAIELEKLTATILLKDELGEPAPYVDISLEGKVSGQSDASGEFRFSPKKIGDSYSVEFISHDELYVSTKGKYLFAHNEKEQSFTIPRQPWIELSLFEPGGFPLSGVQVVSSTGQTGLTDTLGIFRYKVLSKANSVDFTFTKSGFEKTSKSIISQELITGDKIPMPRLQAYFYVMDSRSNKPVKNLQVSVNGKKETVTDFNGKANILPSEKPSKLEIYIDSPDMSYLPLKKTVIYNKNNLGQFMIDKRPIDINVYLRWSTGAPVTGTIEIDIPYEKYVLKRKDGGKHTFQIYNRTFNPTLTVTSLTPTGQPLTIDYPLELPNNGVFSKEIPIVIGLTPNVNIVVDEGVILTIIQHNVTGESEVIINEHSGGYAGAFPDFGDYTIIRSGKGFPNPDSSFFMISDLKNEIDLRIKPLCLESKTFYDNENWNSFIEKVNQLSNIDNCYCDMNKKAGEVSMDKLGEYELALEFYKKITYGTQQCYLPEGDPKIDPFIHLRMLECAVQSNKYDDGIREAAKFDELIQLLPSDTKAQAICNKNYLQGLLMADEYWRLCNESKKVSLKKARAIKKKIEKLGRETVNHLEAYQNQKGNCPSLQIQLEQIRKGC